MPAAGFSVSDGPREFPGKMTIFVVFACLVAATGGLIFGYDIGISGGVTSMGPFLQKFFPSVYEKQREDASGSDNNQYCQFDNHMLTLFTSSLYLAALVAALLASTMTRVFGRRISMLIGGTTFLAGALLNLSAQNLLMLILGRIFLGFGVGFANQSVPLYLSEMAPPKRRGMLNVAFQQMITIGILVANLINYFTAQIKGGYGWRISLGLAVVPAAIITIGSILLPDTPNSLVERGKEEEAKAMLRRIRGVPNVDEEFDDLVAASRESKAVQHPWRNMLDRRYRPQLVMGFLLPLFQQLTGINVVMFYAPELFKIVGFSGNASLMSAVITGTVNVVATFVSVGTVDRYGRRFWLLQGGLQMLASQIAVGTMIASQFGTTGTGSFPSTNHCSRRLHLRVRQRLRLVLGAVGMVGAQRDLPFGDPIGRAERHGGGEHGHHILGGTNLYDDALSSKVRALLLLQRLSRRHASLRLLLPAGNKGRPRRGDDQSLEDPPVLGTLRPR
ncbi:hypothetical protein HPP92_003715 [Vanilla planifolia]|uniref:Major facilitator superfamily (MFS) profile domain-containing protein n=1 Tax=Vanilla planifolia TaxID=51239 RepID=A0A835SH92_VANPL|nr:hypothetical protein HPP92_003715 [Vanilla planifolia]